MLCQECLEFGDSQGSDEALAQRFQVPKIGKISCHGAANKHVQNCEDPTPDFFPCLHHPRFNLTLNC